MDPTMHESSGCWLERCVHVRSIDGRDGLCEERPIDLALPARLIDDLTWADDLNLNRRACFTGLQFFLKNSFWFDRKAERLDGRAEKV